MISFCTCFFIFCVDGAVCPTQAFLIYMFTSPLPLNGFKFVSTVYSVLMVTVQCETFCVCIPAVSQNICSLGHLKGPVYLD